MNTTEHNSVYLSFLYMIKLLKLATSLVKHVHACNYIVSVLVMCVSSAKVCSLMSIHVVTTSV